MVSGSWDIGAIFSIHNKICSTAIWAILATKIHRKHSQQLNQNTLNFRVMEQV